MSPVILPPGFTREFLDGTIQETALLSQIREGYQTISSKSNFTLVEGTGHVGVGSIVQLNNARVAKELGLDMILIASGGLGSAFDELAMNKALCDKWGVKVKGVILNRVLDEKREMILEYFPKALKQWDIPLLGCVPFNPFLSTPSMNDFEVLFETKLISGTAYRYRHYQNTRLIAGALTSYLEDRAENELIITPASRIEIIEAVLADSVKKNFTGGLILTGRTAPTPTLMKQIEEADLPVLYAPICSYDAMKMVTSHVAKIRKEDGPKVERAIQLVEQHINFDLLFT